MSALAPCEQKLIHLLNKATGRRIRRRSVHADKSGWVPTGNQAID